MNGALETGGFDVPVRPQLLFLSPQVPRPLDSLTRSPSLVAGGGTLADLPALGGRSKISREMCSKLLLHLYMLFESGLWQIVGTQREKAFERTLRLPFRPSTRLNQASLCGLEGPVSTLRIARSCHSGACCKQPGLVPQLGIITLATSNPKQSI